MNRYPVWKYVIILIALLVGGLYTLPNFFGEAPAVQVSSTRASVKVDSTTLAKVEQALKAASIVSTGVTLDGSSVRARFDSTDTQLKAKDAIQKALVPDPADPMYIVALGYLSLFGGLTLMRGEVLRSVVVLSASWATTSSSSSA